jgi:hydrogenase maturation protease
VNAGVLVIGVGNEDRGDDTIGLLVARRLRNLLPPSVTIVEFAGDGAALIELWKGMQIVIVIDAARDQDSPGTMHCFDAKHAALPVDPFRSSTHAFGLAEGIELARQLNELPEELIVYGIVGRNFALGAHPSPEVESAGKNVATQIAARFP